MDCEQFERSVLQFVGGELNDVTRAASLRHLDQCRRCQRLEHRIQAAVDHCLLPQVTPSEELVTLIERDESEIQTRLGIGERSRRFARKLADYAMRPQVAMSTMLLLLILVGITLFDAAGDPDDRVAERGIPEQPKELDNSPEGLPLNDELSHLDPPMEFGSTSEQNDAPGVTDSRPIFENSKDGTEIERALNDLPEIKEANLAEAKKLLAEKKFADARNLADAIAARGDSATSDEAVWLAAQAEFSLSGCSGGLRRFDKIAGGNSNFSSSALWKAANCRRASGQLNEAKAQFEQLVADNEYRGRAEEALRALEAQLIVASQKNEKSAPIPVLQSETLPN